MRIHPITRIALGGVLLVGLCTSALAARDKPVDARSDLEALTAATSLDQPGLKPWHLHMTFQLYDLAGKPAEDGTIEEWWISPTDRRLEVRSAAYEETIPSTESGSRTYPRAAYLVSQLLNQIVHPVSQFGDFQQLEATEVVQKFGTLALTCIKVEHANSSHGAIWTVQAPEFCVQPGTNVLRAHLDDGGYGVSRNKLATFQGINTALDAKIAYGNRVAISGQVDRLEAFDPAKTPMEFTHDKPVPSPIPSVSVSKIVKKVAPVYPTRAKEDHITGSVILCAVISKEGTISSIDVVESPNPLLTQASTDAVRQWVYKPLLIDGAPIEVQTAITVNFQMSY